MALLEDQKWESQFAVDTEKKESSLKEDAYGAARGSRGVESVGSGY